MQSLRKYGTYFLDFILPLKCPLTGDEVDSHGALSPSTWSNLQFIDDPKCQKCSLPFPYVEAEKFSCPDCLENPPSYDKAVSSLKYEDTSRALILKFKHGDQLHLAKTFIPFLERSVASMAKPDVIVPVPLHPLRLLKRRYNQAGLLAAGLAKNIHTSYDPNIILRNKHTPQQSGKKARREKNVKNVFCISNSNIKKIKGKTVLIVDDVYTTGATVNACAKTLKQHGAKQVNVVTVARICPMA